MDKWKRLKYFSPSENWGNPDRMNERFLEKLDNYRSILPYGFIVTEGWAASGHTSQSYHYLGRAVDGYFVENKERLSLLSQLELLLRSPFGGIGIYCYDRPFVHMDDRLLTEDRKMWICFKKGEYRKLDLEALKTLFK